MMAKSHKKENAERVANYLRTMGILWRALLRPKAMIMRQIACLDANEETPDGLFTCSDSLIFAHIRPIADFAVRSGLPTLHGFREYVQSGGLMSYGTSFPDQLRRAAYYVDKILKGTKPADLPVEQSMKFELVLNLKTAQALGVTFPPTLLILADEVIR
jgi:putative ABC transport system substrate-binding protein